MSLPLSQTNSPALAEATTKASRFGLEHFGLAHLGNVYWNLSTDALVKEIVFRNEGQILKDGRIVVDTGKHTDLAVDDRFIVQEGGTEDRICWGQHNRPFSEKMFNAVFQRMEAFLQGHDLFVQDCYAGTDPDYQIPVRMLTEKAWHSLFAKTLHTVTTTETEAHDFAPEFVFLIVPSFKASPLIDATNSETFVLIDFDRKTCLIGGTEHAGEIKKAVFSVLNFLLPLRYVLPMHCAANSSSDGKTALFFGLPGAGKTTLAIDPARALVGDDGHGWSDEGVFSLEGGVYAKVAGFSPTANPMIDTCLKKSGTILENVSFDSVSGTIDLQDEAAPENTRASFPRYFVDGATDDGRGNHPDNIIMLTCDAMGVLPPIAKLTPRQAEYQFLSGYSSRLSSDAEPETLFVPCFGAPPVVHHPLYHAELLMRRIERHGANCWLVNTGWTGGGYGVGERIDVDLTRKLIAAALDGSLSKGSFHADPVFGFEVPSVCDGVDSTILDPAQAWSDAESYRKKAAYLAAQFVENFKKYSGKCSPEVIDAGPKK
jgi:phosphoenolpyruvate carboxykinase (ATP)